MSLLKTLLKKATHQPRIETFSVPETEETPPEEESTPVSTPVELAVDGESRVLSATYQPAGDRPPPTRESLLQAARNKGWDEHVLDDALVALFLEACRDQGQATAAPVQAAPAEPVQYHDLEPGQGQDQALAEELAPARPEPVCLPVGALIDGSFTLHIDKSRMSATLDIEPPRGGAAVTEEQVRAALAEQGVVAGILDDALRAAIARGTAVAERIAEGHAPTAGTPTRFESLIESPREAHAEEEDTQDDTLERIDYRDMGNLALVKPGDPLMRRVPAAQGSPGFDISGKPIEPAPVQDAPFAADLAGAILAEDDPELLIATIAGAPRVLPNGVSVTSLVEIDGVNLDTGNIELDGTLRVKGDIAMGMKVRVSGDIIVMGTIEAAEIHAEGNITVNGGIIGMSETVSIDGQEQSRAARLTCGGAIKARFISHAEIDAALTVTVEREVRQSVIDAGESVMVGHPGSLNGVITGGRVRALKSVQAGTLGSMSSTPTDIHVGMDPHAQAKRAALLQKRKELAEQKDKLEKLVLFLQANPQKDVNGVGQRAGETLRKIAVDMTALEAEEAELNAQLEPQANALIAARKRVYGGVTLHIGNKVREFLEDRPGCKAMLNGEGEIALS